MIYLWIWCLVEPSGEATRQPTKKKKKTLKIVEFFWILGGNSPRVPPPVDPPVTTGVWNWKKFSISSKVLCKNLAWKKSNYAIW